MGRSRHVPIPNLSVKKKASFKPMCFSLFFEVEPETVMPLPTGDLLIVLIEHVFPLFFFFFLNWMAEVFIS